MEKLSAQEAEKIFQQLLQRVSNNQERIILQQQGQDKVALISVNDLNKITLFEQFIDFFEDKIDIFDAELVKNDKNDEVVSFAEAKKTLGL